MPMRRKGWGVWIILALLVSLIAGCGDDGGGGAQNRTATVKLGSAGTVQSNLAGVSMTVAIPPGVSAATDDTGAVLATVVVPSGVTANEATVPPQLVIYQPATATAAGTLTFVLVGNSSAGFGPGEFAQLTLTVSPASDPAPEEFAVTGFSPVDIGGRMVSGLTPTVSATIR
ncbi:hypothetical protein GMSM_22650 [Geomonas sp. Red276]